MKDPAILFYKDKWLSATKGMRANAKGWYLNLIIFQHEFGDLPNDIEELANLCDVRFTEYTEFEHVFEHVLKQKFELNENNRLENSFAREITQNRETFKEQRSNSGKLSYVLRYFRKNFKYKAGFEDWFKKNVPIDFDIKDEHMLEHVFKQNLELYINVNINVNNSINLIEEKEEKINQISILTFDEFWNLYDKKVGNKTKLKSKFEKLNEDDRTKILKHVPNYVDSTPDKKFRKDPETYINNQSWNDEIIYNNGTKTTTTNRRTNKEGTTWNELAEIVANSFDTEKQ